MHKLLRWSYSHEACTTCDHYVAHIGIWLMFDRARKDRRTFEGAINSISASDGIGAINTIYVAIGGRHCCVG